MKKYRRRPNAHTQSQRTAIHVIPIFFLFTLFCCYRNAYSHSFFTLNRSWWAKTPRNTKINAPFPLQQRLKFLTALYTHNSNWEWSNWLNECITVTNSLFRRWRPFAIFSQLSVLCWAVTMAYSVRAVHILVCVWVLSAFDSRSVFEIRSDEAESDPGLSRLTMLRMHEEHLK